MCKRNLIAIALLSGCASPPAPVLLDGLGAGPHTLGGDQEIGHDLGQSTVCEELQDPEGRLDWCVRVSPEPVSHSTDGEVDDDGASSQTGQAQGANRCGFTNLLGGMGLAGDLKHPVISYCDSDPTGGVRAVRLDPYSGGILRGTISEGDCQPSPQGGGTINLPDGRFLAAWTDIYSARALSWGPDLTPTEAPWVLGPSTWTAQLTESAVALADTEQGELLWLDDDGRPSSLPSSPAPHVEELAVAQQGDEVVIASCAPDGQVLMTYLQPGEPAPAVSLAIDAWCHAGQSLSLSVDGDHTVVVWSDLQSGGAAFLADHELITVQPLRGTEPAVALVDTGWLTLDSSGDLISWSPDGLELDRQVHPHVQSAQHIIDLDLMVEGDSTVIAMTDERTLVSGPHLYIWHVLEISGMRWR